MLIKGGDRIAMKRLILIAVVSGLTVTMAGCGRKHEPISETQEPISIEELSKFDASTQVAPEAVKTAPAVMVTSSSALPPELPPSGPFKPTANEIQTALKNAGFYAGAVDGKSGPQTKKAIEDFQKANGLDVDGKVGPKTWAVLGKYLNPDPVVTPVRKRR